MPDPACSTERRRLRRFDYGLIAVLVVYLTLAIGRETKMGRQEIFPFASFSLFSLVPNEVSDHSVRLLAIGGRELEAPLFFEDSGRYFPRATFNASRTVIKDLGLALAAGRAEQAAELRACLEHIYLAGQGPVVYEVVRRRYDPLERWREGRFREIRPVATLHAHAPGEAQ